MLYYLNGIAFKYAIWNGNNWLEKYKGWNDKQTESIGPSNIQTQYITREMLQLIIELAYQFSHP